MITKLANKGNPILLNKHMDCYTEVEISKLLAMHRINKDEFKEAMKGANSTIDEEGNRLFTKLKVNRVILNLRK